MTQPFKVWLGGGEGSLYLHHYLIHPFKVWSGGSFYLHHYLNHPFRVWLGGRGRIRLENRSLVACDCLLTSPFARWRMDDGGGGEVWGGVCEDVLLLLAQKHICYTMSRSSPAPVHQHDFTLSHLLLTLSSS